MLANRRTFLKTGVAGTLACALSGDLEAGLHKPGLTMGLIADLHHGLAPTAMSRLDAFIQSVVDRQPDCVLQLGDFNYGKPTSVECMDLWNGFEGPKYHVLGNHDMDAFSKRHMVEFWGMRNRYYSFDAGGWHCVVLDRNNLFVDGKFKAYDAGNYYVAAEQRGFADAEQLDWLKQDLAQTRLPTVVLAHQGLGMENDTKKIRAPDKAIEEILANANAGEGRSRVVACFCGHHHIDRYNFKDSIHYVWINSASYYWVGAKYGRMAAYRDPLFCFVKFFDNGSIEIEGRQSDWVSPTPAERKFPGAENLTPFISDRRLS